MSLRTGAFARAISRAVSPATLLQRTPPIPASILRRRRLASSLPNIPESLQQSPLFTKLRNSPEVLARIIKISELFQARGIKMDEKPSFTDMMTLARDQEIQTAMRDLKSVMDEEGITLDVQELLKNMPK